MTREFKTANDLISWIESLPKISEDYSLDKMNKLNKFFSEPTKNIKFIHIAGTNGKGSVSLALTKILLEKGYNVGTFTSPFITCFNERIMLNEQYISDEDLLDIGNYIISKYSFLLTQMKELSFFEFVTILMFIYFKRKNVDIAVIEVGLGGKYDPTNIIKPLLSVICQIDYDHCEILGNDIKEIALNKLGIVKREVPLVTFKDERIDDIIENVCKENNTSLVLIDKKNINVIKANEEVTLFKYQDQLFKSNLLGCHQAENMSIVIESINTLNKFYNFNITSDNVLNGLNKVHNPGRLEILNKKPLVFLDGAHNPNGIARLIEFLQIIKNNRRIVMIIAFSKTKDILSMLKKISDICDELYLGSFNNSYDTALIQQLIIENDILSLQKLHFLSDINEDICTDNDTIYVYCGSLYFIREIKKINKK